MRLCASGLAPPLPPAADAVPWLPRSHAARSASPGHPRASPVSAAPGTWTGLGGGTHRRAAAARAGPARPAAPRWPRAPLAALLAPPWQPPGRVGPPSWPRISLKRRVEKAKNLRLPRLELGPGPWQGPIIPLDYRRLLALHRQGILQYTIAEHAFFTQPARTTIFTLCNGANRQQSCSPSHQAGCWEPAPHALVVCTRPPGGTARRARARHP